MLGVFSHTSSLPTLPLHVPYIAVGTRDEPRCLALLRAVHERLPKRGGALLIGEMLLNDEEDGGDLAEDAASREEQGGSYTLQEKMGTQGGDAGKKYRPGPVNALMQDLNMLVSPMICQGSCSGDEGFCESSSVHDR